MRPSRKIKIFNDRYPFVGPAFYMASLQFFIVMVACALAWPTHYSALNNTISDLGNTACGAYSGRYVCSPWHALMNVSFVTLGITMMAGSALVYQEFKKTAGSAL